MLDAPAMGKKTRYELSREGERFHWLLNQLWNGGRGLEQKQISKATGLSRSYLNTWIHIKDDSNAGRTGFGTEIIRRVKDGLKISPDYFFDDYEGQADHRLYLLSAKRDEVRMAAVETKQAQFASELAQIRAALAEKDAIIHTQASELALLRNKVLQSERAAKRRPVAHVQNLLKDGE